MYDKSVDELYETTIFINELLKLRDYVSQAFNLMNNEAQWGAEGGVDFHGTPIRTGNAKGTHNYWGPHISLKQTYPPLYSDVEGDCLKIDKSLRNAVLFSLRMNLHVRNVLDEDQQLTFGGFDEDGTINYELDDYIVKEIGWIVEPKQFLAECLGGFLNRLRAQVQVGMNSNWGQLTRGSGQWTLFEDFCTDAHTVLIGNHAAKISDIDVYAEPEGQKELVNSIKFLHKIKLE